MFDVIRARASPTFGTRVPAKSQQSFLDAITRGDPFRFVGNATRTTEYRGHFRRVIERILIVHQLTSSSGDNDEYPLRRWEIASLGEFVALRGHRVYCIIWLCRLIELRIPNYGKTIKVRLKLRNPYDSPSPALACKIIGGARSDDGTMTTTRDN